MNLLQLANFDLRYASMAMMTYFDEGAVRNCAFLIQQAIEKTLKYILLEQLQPSEFTHDISLLTSQVEMQGGYVPPYIKDTAKRISSWQSHARYSRKFEVNEPELEKTFMEAQSYVEHVANHYKLKLIA